jgi:aspartate oxidase
LFDEDTSANKKDKKKKKRDSYEQIKRKMTRNVDVAADNKALNEGITDIAGMGAAEAPAKKSQPHKADNQANLAQQLLSGTFGASSPQSSSQDENEGQFL